MRLLRECTPNGDRGDPVFALGPNRRAVTMRCVFSRYARQRTERSPRDKDNHSRDAGVPQFPTAQCIAGAEILPLIGAVEGG